MRAWLERALVMIGDSRSELRAALVAHRAEMCFELPTSERMRLLDEADALAAQSGTPEVLLEIALCRASLRDPTALDESRRAIERYRALARQHRRVLSAPQRLLQEFGVVHVERRSSATRRQTHRQRIGKVLRCKIG